MGIGNKPGPTELLIRAAVLLIVKEVRKTEARIMSTLDEVIAKVADNSSVVNSAAALIDGLQDKLEAALKEVNSGYEPEKLKAVIDALEADKARLIEAMKENTIAEIEPTPVVEPAPEPAPVETAPAEPVPAPAEAPIAVDQDGNPI